MSFELTKALTPFMTSKNYSEGSVINSDLIKSGQVLLVASGSVLVEYASIDTEKDRRIGVLLTEHKFVGLEYLFGTRRKSQSQVTAVQESTVLSITISSLRTLLEGDLFKYKPEVLDAMGQCMAESMFGLQYRLESLAVHSHYPKENILSVLTQLAAKIGISNGKGGTTVPVKLDTISKLTGLSEESTRRCTSLLVADGRIAKIGKGNFLVFS